MFLEKYMIIELCYGCRHVRVPLAVGLAGGALTLPGMLDRVSSSGSPGMQKRVSDIRLRHNVDTALM
jgi:hypothetical protein